MADKIIRLPLPGPGIKAGIISHMAVQGGMPSPVVVTILQESIQQKHVIFRLNVSSGHIRIIFLRD